jgi:sulfate adenylyltransferase large subunit
MHVIPLEPFSRHAHPASGTGLLRFVTAGSVDDGKSTLIGRLLYDTQSVPLDLIEAIRRSAAGRGGAELDLSLITDGLEAEREQGITIDVAYRYFATPKRKFIICDAPGHEQYTRNMVSAASTAGAAVVLVDAKKGITTQTRRHSCLVHLLGVSEIILAVNKMDLVGWRRSVFNDIVAKYAEFATALGIKRVKPIPLSALHGDNVARNSEASPWYEGPSLLEHLECLSVDMKGEAAALRLPIQRVVRPHSSRGIGRRIYQCTLAAGFLREGDSVLILPSGRKTRVTSIRQAGESLIVAAAGQAVAVELEDDLDVSRGDMLVSPEAPARVAGEIEAQICWLGTEALDLRQKYRIKHTTRSVPGRFAEIIGIVDVNTLDLLRPSGAIDMNDIFAAKVRLQQPLVVDPYSTNHVTGSFIIVDEASCLTVGAGIVR